MEANTKKRVKKASVKHTQKKRMGFKICPKMINENIKTQPKINKWKKVKENKKAIQNQN